MLNFNGIYQCALHRSAEERSDEVIDKARVEALRREVESRAEWPKKCPWIGTDAWLMRFVVRADDAMKEPVEKDKEGRDRPKHSALDRVINCLKWREDNYVNDILDDPDLTSLQCSREWPLEAHGVDKFGVPVYYERVALVYPRSFMDRFTQEQSFRFALYSRELIAKQVYEASKGLRSRYIHVCSASNLGLRHGHSPLFEILDKVFMNDEANYPVSVRQYFVIHTPWLFSLFKGLLSPFVNSEPLQKIKAHGHDFIDDMEKYIDNVEIPKEYGGGCRAHIAKCCLKEYSEARLIAPLPYIAQAVGVVGHNSNHEK